MKLVFWSIDMGSTYEVKLMIWSIDLYVDPDTHGSACESQFQIGAERRAREGIHSCCILRVAVAWIQLKQIGVNLLC